MLYRPILALIACIFAMCFSTIAQSDQYPSRSIRFIVAFSPASPTYLAARIVADRLSQDLHVPVIVESQPSGAGVAAALALKNAQQDGYTIGMLSSVHAIRLSLMRQPPYSPDDFRGVTQFSVFADIFAAAMDSPYRTFADAIEAARQKPEELKVATTPVGAAPYLAVLLLNDAAGIKLTPIPYKDVRSAPLDVVRGDVQFILQPYAVLQSQLGSGLRALAVVSPKRMPYLADVPSISEMITNYEGDETWNGIFAPKGTPPEMVDLLNRSVGSILADANVKKQFLQLGVVASPSTPSELDALLRSEAARWKAVIRDQKIPQEE